MILLFVHVIQLLEMEIGKMVRIAGHKHCPDTVNSGFVTVLSKHVRQAPTYRASDILMLGTEAHPSDQKLVSARPDE